MSNHYLHKIAKSCSETNGYLIMVLDGTGSMSGEYNKVVEAYKKIFRNRIERNTIQSLQFGHGITKIEPFQSAGSGNFNEAFGEVLNKIRQLNQKNITICVVSDGIEPFDMARLKQQYSNFDLKQFQIQFTSIAVGEGYPVQLFQGFREFFHNGPSSCTNVQFLNRNASALELEKALEIVNSQVDQQYKVTLTQAASSTLNGILETRFNQGEVVYSKYANVQGTNGEKVEQTTKPEDLDKIVKTSVQEMIKNQTNLKFQNISEQAQQISIVAKELFQQVPKSNIQKIDSIAKDLTIVDDIVQGKIKIQNLNQAQQTQLLSSFNPKPDEKEQNLFKEQFEILDKLVQQGIKYLLDNQHKIHQINDWCKEIEDRCLKVYEEVQQFGSQVVKEKLNLLKYNQQILNQIESGKLDLNTLNEFDQNYLAQKFKAESEVNNTQAYQKEMITRLKAFVASKSDVQDQWITLLLLDETVDTSNLKDRNEIFRYIANLQDYSMTALRNQMKSTPAVFEELIDIHLHRQKN